MSKKNIIIIGIIAIILTFFGTRSYYTIENQNSNYPTIESQIENNPIKTESKIKLENKSSSGNQKVFKYSSDFYDIEMPNGTIITKNEVTYHTIDFNKMTITQSSMLDGKRVDLTYPFKGMYKETGIIASTYVLTVNTLGLKEFWWSPEVPNLGYDYDDGTRIACYDIEMK